MEFPARFCAGKDQTRTYGILQLWPQPCAGTALHYSAYSCSKLVLCDTYLQLASLAARTCKVAGRSAVSQKCSQRGFQAVSSLLSNNSARQQFCCSATVTMGKQALLCIDMQNDFVLPDAPLRVQCAMECLPHCKHAIAEARRAGIPVVWVIREHDSQGTYSVILKACALMRAIAAMLTLLLDPMNCTGAFSAAQVVQLFSSSSTPTAHYSLLAHALICSCLRKQFVISDFVARNSLEFECAMRVQASMWSTLGSTCTRMEAVALLCKARPVQR